MVDEWGIWTDVEPGTNPGFLYQQNSLRDAIVAAVNLNIFNNHCDRVKMANIAQTINVLQAVILTDKEKMLLTPTYWAYYLYKVHQDATLLPIFFTSRVYHFVTHMSKSLEIFQGTFPWRAVCYKNECNICGALHKANKNH